MTRSRACEYLIAHYGLQESAGAALREANDAIEGFYRDAEPLKPGAAPQGMLAFEAAARS
ncbi:MAG TPA: hypothetical protein IAB57_06715 [Candidatus Fimivivens faecavium]|nr:hypothetical protein [Candidatus Fimivivens faecavium]